ncbi:radical SAM protein [Thermoproteota archaeon]
MPKKVFIINEPFIRDFCRNQRWPAKTRGRAIRPPDWLAYVAAILEKEGLEVKLLDFPANNWSKDKYKDKVREGDPDFIVLDSTTPSIFSDIECARIGKEYSKAKVIMVGTHVTAYPEEAFKLARDTIDVIALGEYDYTVRDIILNFDDLERVDGIAYKEGGRVIFTRERSLIQDLDSLPFPAWHHLDIMKYFDATRLYPHIDIIGGRGCPYLCTFCQWPQLMYGNKLRLRSPSNIVDEIESDLSLFPQLKHGEFFFEDDTFTINKERAHSICDEIKRRNLKICWSANARSDIYDLDLFKKMKEMGCRELLVGFETGSQEIMDNIKKGANVNESSRFVEVAREAKIAVHGCFVLGLPGETRETMQKTLDFALGLNLNTIQFSAAVPLPGTEYYDYCKKNGLLKAKSWEDWLEGNEQGAVVSYPNLSADEVNRFVDKGLKSFYFRPSYIIKFIFETQCFSDFYRKVRGGFNFITYLFKR